MGQDHVGNRYLGTRRQRGSVFMDMHGHDQTRSVSVSPTNRHTTPQSYLEIPEGQVLSLHTATGLYYPTAKDAAQAAVTSANVVTVADPWQFQIGDLAELGGVGFRRVTAVEKETAPYSITLAGTAFDMAEGALVEVDPGRAATTVDGTQAAPGADTSEIDVVDASEFAVGDLVTIGENASLVVAATLTFDDGVPAIVEIQIPGDTHGEYIFEVAQATGAAESVLALLTEINATMPANTVAATQSGGILLLTAENGTEFSADFGFGADPDTGAWDVVINDTTEAQVTAVDAVSDPNTITVVGDIGVTDGDLIVSEAPGKWRLATETVSTSNYQWDYQNVLVPIREHGEVRERLCIGLTADAKAYMQPLIRFNATLN